jgi:predicted transcriptional regulator
MPDDVAIAAQISAELDRALTRLASARGESKSALVREAVQFYVQSEEEFLVAVEEGLAAVRARHLIDDAEVMREINALLAEKRNARR